MLSFLKADYSGIMDINLWTLIFTWVNLGVLVLILKKFLYKPVKKMFAEREAEVKETYDKADIARHDAEELKSEYEGRLSAAKQEAAEILSNASRKANQRSEETIKEAHKKASVILQKAEEEIADERKRAVNALKDDISDLALAAAGRVIKKELDIEDHKELIEQFIENAGDADWQS